MFNLGDHFDRWVASVNELSRPIPKPGWTSPNRIKLELDSVILRDFSVGDASVQSGQTILIIPPQAGHHSSIADYDRGQSLVEAALQSGCKSVYVAEWKSATWRRKHETIDDFILAMSRCIESLEGKVTLIGLCQGGWQSAIYTALFPQDVSNLVLAGAPIDFEADFNKIGLYASILPMSFYQSMVDAGGGILDGKYLLTGFKMLNPADRFIGDKADLYFNVHDKAYMKRYRKFRDWYEHTENLPGAFYLQAIKELFKENRLVKGELRILGQKVDLRNIHCPLYLLAGDKDEITPQKLLFQMERYVSSRKIMKMVVPAGHIGVFMGSKIVKDYWPQVFKAIRRQETFQETGMAISDLAMAENWSEALSA